MSPDLFNEIPFNLAGESLNAEHDAQVAADEARVRALAESEARKAQKQFWPKQKDIAYGPHKRRPSEHFI